MLRYEVRQLHLEDTARFYLPIPKFTEEQLTALGADLERRGFATTRSGVMKVSGHGTRFTVNPAGLASSSEDLLDPLIPSLVKLLGFQSRISDSNPYFAAKRKEDHLEVQFFPRMEALRIWTSLRKCGECGLTPDEEVLLEGLLRRSRRPVDCVTDYPTDNCVPLQIGRNQYFSSRISPSEFLSNLRTLSHHSSKNAYLPRSSLIQVDSGVGPVGGLSLDLREWCFFLLRAQNL